MRIRKEISHSYITEKDHQIAALANALSHPLRVALVRYLDDRGGAEGLDKATCNKDLVDMFAYSQSTISQHVKVLKESGLFITKNKDKFTLYYLNADLINEFSEFISNLCRASR